MGGYYGAYFGAYFDVEAGAAQPSEGGGGVLKKQRPRISYADLAPSVSEAARMDIDDDVLVTILL